MTKKLLFFATFLLFSLSNLIGQCSASFSFSNTKCEGDSIHFSYTGSGDSLFWNFDDLSSGSYNYSTDSNVTHIFYNKGTFNVRLIVKDTSGCCDTVINTLNIFNKPSVNYSIVNTCKGLLSAINNLSTSDTNNIINNYLYTLGDGNTSNLSSFNYSYSTSGIYAVKLKVSTINGCADSISKSIKIFDKPSLQKSLDSICQVTDINFDVNHGSDLVSSYLWNLGDSSTNNNKYFLHQYNSPGIKKITLKLTYTAGNYCVINSDSVLVFKKPNSFFQISTALKQCYKGNLNCVTFGLDTTGIKYRNIIWDDGASINVNNNASSACHKYANKNGGRYNITNEVIDSNGCAARYTVIDTIEIYKDPKANFTLVKTGGCFKTFVSVSNTSNMSPLKIKRFIWNWGDSSSLDSINWTGASHIYNANGAFRIKLNIKDTFGCVDTVLSSGTVNNTSYIVDSRIDKVLDSCRTTNKFSFKQTPISGATIKWYMGDLDSVINNWSFNYSYYKGRIYGTYKPRIIISKNGCDSSLNLKDAIVYGPYAESQITNRFQCQIQDTVKFLNITTSYKNKALLIKWNAGDPYAPNCTLDSSNNYTLDSNCNNSRDSLHFQHYYTPGKENCYYLRITAIDTALGCTDSNLEPMPLDKPDAADGINFIKRYSNNLCLGPENYKIVEVNLNQSNRSCYRENYWIMWDSLCAEQSGNFNANWENQNRFHTYNYVPCDSTGKVTIGVIIQNGKDTLGNVCRDTAFYHHIINFGVIDPRFTTTYNPLLQYCKNTSFDFYLKDSTLDSIVNVTWDFGDGTIENNLYLGKRTHKYKKHGKYTVIFRIQHINGCSAIDSMHIKIGNDPRIILPKARICVNDSIFITNNTRYWNGPSYWNNPSRIALGLETTRWDIGDGSGFSINNQSAILNYNKIGNYNVRFEFTDSMGCVDTFNVPYPIRVFNVFSDITLPSNKLICAQVVQFKSSASVYDSLNNFGHPDDSLVEFSWFFDNGTSNSLLKNPFKFFKAGWHNVKLIAKNTAGCTDEYTDSIFINGPLANYVILGDTMGCMPLTVTFKNKSTNANSYTWFYKNQSNNASVTPSFSNINFTYTQYGNFRPQLIARNTFLNNGINVNCADTFVVNPNTEYSPQIVVYEKPRPAFSHVTNCATYTSQFTNTSALTTGTITKYEWFFGDGDTSQQINPTHHFNDSGKYKIVLRAYSPNGCVDSVVRLIYIYPNPLANFTFNDVCFGKVTNFRDASLGYNDVITTFAWNFGNGVTNGARNPNYIYPKDSISYNVTLNVTNRSGCTNGITKQVTVWARPKPNFNPVNVCYKSPTLLYNTGTSKQSLAYNTWQLGDNTTTVSNYFYKTYTDTGKYTIKLKATSMFGCEDSITKQVRIYPNPKSDFTINNTIQCLNQNKFVFNNTSTINSGNIANTIWQLSDSYGAFTTNLTYKFIAPSDFSVRLISRSNLNCYDTIIKFVKVLPSPKAIINLSDNEKCIDADSILFKDKSTIDSNIVSRLWKLEVGKTSTLKTFKYKYLAAANYPVSLQVQNTAGCRDTANTNIIIHPKPKALIGYKPLEQCYSGNAFLFKDSSKIASPYFLRTRWNFGDLDTSILVNISHTYTTVDTFKVRLISLSNKECRDTAYQKVVVHPMPFANFTTDKNTACLKGNSFTFTNASTVSKTTLSYVWKFGDNSQSTSTNTTHSYLNFGTFNAKLIAKSAFGCKDSIAKPITVYAMPKADFKLIDSALCFRNNKVTAINTSTIGQGTYTNYWTTLIKTQTGNDTFKVSYAQDSVFKVKLKTVSNFGCLDSITKNTFIWPMPIAKFKVDSSAQCLRGNKFKFTNSSSAKDVSLTYQWNFGNGVISKTKDTAITYSTYGTALVQLIANSIRGCKDTLKLNLTIHPMPKAKAGINDSLQCLNTQNFVFKDNSTIPYGSLKRQWKWGDLTTDTAKNISHYYNKDTSYANSLISVSNKLCADTAKFNITARSVPKAKFAINDSDQCLPIQNFVFTNQSNIKTGSINYQWLFGNGNTSTAVSTTNKYNTSGNYTVQLKAISNFGCRDSISKKVIVFYQPKAKLTVLDSAQCLRFNQFNLVGNSTIAQGSIVGYNWDTSGLNANGLKDYTLSYKTYGTKQVRYIVKSDNSCFDTLFKTLTIHPMPKSLFTINQNIQCVQNNSFVFNATSTIPFGTMKYAWLIKNTFIDSGITITKTFNVADTPAIRLVTTSNKQCTDTIIKPIFIQPTPKALFTINNSGQCLKGNNFIFTNNSTSASALSSNWKFGDGVTGTNKNETHSYTNWGLYNVKLLVSSAYNCKDSITKPITVYAMPKADFKLIDSALCFRNNKVTAINTSTIGQGTYTNYWTTLIKTQTGNDTFKVSYAQDSVFKVKLKTVSNFGCLDSIIKNTFIWPMPIAKFKVDSAAQCLRGNKFKFTNSSSAKDVSLTYQWNFGNGVISKTKDTAITYSTYGTAIVQLIANSIRGCKDTLKLNLTIHPMPKAKAGINDSLQCLNTQNFVFKDNNTIAYGSLKRQWKWGDLTTDTAKNISHYYSKDTTFANSLISVSNKLCADTAKFNITVRSVPKAKFAINDSDQCLPIQNFVFTNQSNIKTGSINYQWLFGNGNTSTAVSSTNKYNTSGNYTVQLKAISNFGCRDSISKKVIVFYQPKAILKINDSSQCLRFNQFNLVGNSTIAQGSIIGYNWDTSNLNFNGLKDAQFSFKTIGNKTIRYIVESNQNCFDTTYRSIAVNPMPVSRFNINDTIQCAQKNNFVLNATSSIPYGSMTYHWLIDKVFKDSGISISKSFSVTDTVVTRLVTVSDKKCTDTTFNTLFIQPTPAAKFSINDSGQCLYINHFIFKNNSKVGHGSLTNLWRISDGFSSTALNTNHTFAKHGDFDVQLNVVSNYGCVDSAMIKVLVHPEPKANFGINDASQCLVGNNFALNNVTAIDSTSLTYKWQYGDGENGILTNPQHTYLKDGNYTIGLVATSQYQCKDSIKHGIIINPMPKANFFVNDSSQCINEQAFNFNNTSTLKKGKIINHTWRLNTETIAQQNLNNYKFNTSGIKTVLLAVQSDSLCIDSIYKNVRVYAKPAADFNINDSVQCLTGNSFTFTTASKDSIGFGTYLWKIDGNQETASPAFVRAFAQPRTYNIELEATSQVLCKDTIQYKVRVKPMPDPSFKTLKPYYCNNEPPEVLIPTVPGGLFSGKNVSGNLLVPTQLFKDTVKYTVTVEGCTSSSQQYTNIYPLPYINLGPDSTLCKNESVILKANNWNSKYLWQDGATDAEYFALKAGLYWVKATNVCGSYTDSIELKFRDKNCRLWLPTAFTPNRDGQNEVYKPITYGVTEMSYEIFNRWGEKVYEGNQNSTGWDGTFMGEPVYESYFLIIVNYSFINSGKKFNFTESEVFYLLK